MSNTAQEPAARLRGYTQLTVEALANLTDIVEAMHATIARSPWILGKSHTRTGGITGLVYDSIRKVTQAVGSGLDESLAKFASALGDASAPSPTHEMILAALNGVVGDYLAERNNALATPMQFRRNGVRLSITPEALRSAVPQATGKLAVMVHGSCSSDLMWEWKGHNHGALLETELGYTPVYLLYNSGRHISTNGREFAALLEQLLSAWPVPLEDFVIVAHSMGGLVTRSAMHYALEGGHTWVNQVSKALYLGTPHHGAPLERGGNIFQILMGVTPYSAPLASLGKLRSAGITDLRHGFILDSDWDGHDRFAHRDGPTSTLQLHDGIEHFTLAACLVEKRSSLGDRLLGDGLVPVHSALGRHDLAARCLNVPESNQWIGYGMGHMDLLGRRDVFDVLQEFLSEPPLSRTRV